MVHQSAAKKRIIFASISIILFLLEVYIGIYVHDNFVRPYLGDTIVVILLYTMARTIFVDNFVWLSGGIFIFATLVEISQIFPLCDLLHIQNTLIRVLMGTSFSFIDIIAYFFGCLITLIYDLSIIKPIIPNLIKNFKNK